jgi:hypothetical protein
MKKRNRRSVVLVSLFAAGALASGVAAPALAEDNGPAGTWDGVLEQNGARKMLAMRFDDLTGIWSGRLQIDGVSSAMESLRVERNHVSFDLPGQGTFDGTVTNDSLAGSVSGGGSAGSFSATRGQAEFPTPDPIYPQGP